MSRSCIEVEASLDSLGLVRDFIETQTSVSGLSADMAGELLLAVDEAVSNIVMHGTPRANSNIEILVDVDAQSLTAMIRDAGPLFDPTQSVDPHLEISPLERQDAGGFGLYLLNHLVDKVAYHVTEDGRNELSLTKNLC